MSNGQRTPSPGLKAIDLNRTNISDTEVRIGSADGFTVLRVDGPVTMKINDQNADPIPVVPGKWCGNVERIYITSDPIQDGFLYIAIPRDGVDPDPSSDGQAGVRLQHPRDPNYNTGDRFVPAQAGYQRYVMDEIDVFSDTHSEDLFNYNHLSILVAVTVRNLIGTPSFTPVVSWIPDQTAIWLVSRKPIWKATTPLTANGEHIYNLATSTTAEFDQASAMPIPYRFSVGVEVTGGASGTSEADIRIMVAFIP